MRHFTYKLAKLSKEWLGEIIIHSVTFWIPFIAPPTFVAVNNYSRVWSIKRDNRFTAQFAFAGIKGHIISPSIPALTAALRTKSRRRDFYFFIKPKIVRLDDKIFFTILAYSVFVLIVHFIYLII